MSFKCKPLTSLKVKKVEQEEKFTLRNFPRLGSAMEKAAKDRPKASVLYPKSKGIHKD